MVAPTTCIACVSSCTPTKKSKLGFKHIQKWYLTTNKPFFINGGFHCLVLSNLTTCHLMFIQIQSWCVCSMSQPLICNRLVEGSTIDRRWSGLQSLQAAGPGFKTMNFDRSLMCLVVLVYWIRKYEQGSGVAPLMAWILATPKYRSRLHWY